MRWLRNQVVAPLTEELVFRACMLPMLVPCAGPSTAIFTCPLFFGVGEFSVWISTLYCRGWVLFPWQCCGVSWSSLPPCDWADEVQTGYAVWDLPLRRWALFTSTSCVHSAVVVLMKFRMNHVSLVSNSVPVLLHGSIWSLHCFHLHQNRWKASYKHT